MNSALFDEPRARADSRVCIPMAFREEIMLKILDGICTISGGLSLGKGSTLSRNNNPINHNEGF
jgi:hypothetical protein